MVNKEKRRESGKRSYQRHKEQRRAKWDLWASKNKEHLREYKRKQCARRRIELKDEIYARLGNKCVQCGFTDIRAVQIDHVRDNGAAERRTLGRDITYLVAVLKSVQEKGSEEYQLLCANCNWIKRYTN